MNRENDFHLLESLAKRNKRRRLLKRGLALLSAVVLLFTVNALKRLAVAMEHRPNCEYHYDHTHTDECFDAAGELICGLHEHTDECYQEQVDEVPEELEVDLADIAEEDEADGSEDANADIESVDEADEIYEVEMPADGSYDMNGADQAMLSEILAAADLPVKNEDIQMVGLVDDDNSGDAPVAIALVDQDFAVSATSSFDSVELAIVTADTIYTVKLLNGGAAAPAIEEAEEVEAIEEAEEVEIVEESEVTEEAEEAETVEESEVTEEAEEVETVEESEVTEDADADGASGAEEIAEDSEAEEAIEAAEEVEATEEAETIEQAEVTEQAEESEQAEKTEVTEQAEESEKAEKAEVTEQADEAEEAEHAEVTEEAEDKEEAEEAEEAEETEETEETEEAEKADAEDAVDEALYPAQTFEGRAGSVRVNVTAEAGAFPADTTMRVSRVWDRDTLDGIADAVTEDFVEVKKVMAVDIAFFDAEGSEIEPLRPIAVVMTVDEIEEQQEAVVVHMDDEGNAEVMEQSEAPQTGDEKLALNVELPAGEAPVTDEAADEAADETVEETADEAADETAAEETAVEAPAAEDAGETVEYGEEAAEAADETDGAEALEIVEEAVQPEDANETVAFEADAFSVYAVVVTETIDMKYIANDGATYDISVGYGPEALIPAGATLAVKELTGEATEDYLARTEDMLAEGERITLARYFDITILDADGAEVQPAAPVRVSVKLADDDPSVAVQAVHFAEEGEPERIAASREDDEAVAFDARSFSVYGIVYTVDFYYDVDGKTFEYHINGGDVLSLKALLPILKVVEDDPETEQDEVLAFVQNIQSVRFSDESLVRVVPVTEDITAGAILDALGVHLEAFAAGVDRAPAELPEEDIDAIEASGENADAGIEEAAPSAELTKEDIERIKAKTFTAPDWALVSLKPFTSHETLTITLKNGEVVTVKVEDAWDNAIKTYPSYAGTINVSGTDRGNNVVARLVQTNGNGRNSYRFFAVPKPGYVFAKWKETNMGDDGSNSWDFYDLSDPTNTTVLSDSMSMDIFNSRNHDMVATFDTIHRRVGVESDDKQKGRILAPGPYYTREEAWYGDNWNNNGMNSQTIEAIPDEGYVFVRWNYYEEVTSNNWQLATPSDIDLYQQSFAPGTLRVDRDGKGWFLKAVFATTHVKVSVNNESVGDVVRLSDNASMKGQYITDEQGNLLPGMEIKAKPTNSNYAFSHWTLNGAILDIASDTITADNWPEEVRGDDLQAVFAKVIDANGSAHSTIHVDDDEKEKFQRWLASLESDEKLSADKTAKVYDYDNRIYQIDITAESARVNPYANIGVAFILDASNSMQFPSHLQKTGKTMVLTQETMNAAFPGENGPYYIISEPTKTATVYRIFKESDGIWYSIDASYYYDKDGIYKNYKWPLSSRIHFADVSEAADTLLAYPIYQAVGDKKRVDYLNQSMAGTINAMRDIVTKVGNDNYNISVAHTMFAAFTEHYYDTAHVPGKLGSFHTVDFRKLGANDGININMGDTDGGTRHDLGLQEAINYINWDDKGIPSDQRYAILISDGAAVINGGSNGTTWDGHNYSWIQSNIVTQANNLKAKGVKLITVGLSTKNVDGGSNVLKNIASDGLFFEAESGEDLENILYKILQTVVKNATSCGQIVDEVDEAFYPVMPDGTPIPEGTTYYKYGDNGQIIQLSKAEYDDLGNWAPRFKWEGNNGKWKITWEHQYIGWDSTDSDSRKRPWHESFLVKAKEDFLGGNTINTNTGTCQVIEDGYTYDDTLLENVNNWQGLWNPTKETVDLPVPYVNVDELSLTHNNSEWTVYLGTEVDPLDELKRLYGEILVNEVVTHTTNGAHKILNTEYGGQMIYDMVRSDEDGRAPKAGVQPETFPLSTVVPLSAEDWTALKSGNAVTKPYTAYGHQNVGSVVLQLTQIEVKPGEDGLTDGPHATKVEGQGVEKYTLTATYIPAAESTPASGWHTAKDGSHGHTTNNMDSQNRHVINVFAKGLMLKKMDATLENELTGAEFRLYRTARADESGSAERMEIEGGSYVPVSEAKAVDENGIVDMGYIARLPEGEQYYLVETQAPEGYTPAAPMLLTLEIDETVTYKPRQDDHNCPYDWTQTARLSLGDPAKRSDEEWTDKNDLENDSATYTVRYRIPNYCGATLPATGGMGTGIYTLAGAGLVLLAVALMLIRRRQA